MPDEICCKLTESKENTRLYKIGYPCGRRSADGVVLHDGRERLMVKGSPFLGEEGSLPVRGTQTGG